MYTDNNAGIYLQGYRLHENTNAVGVVRDSVRLHGEWHNRNITSIKTTIRFDHYFINHNNVYARAHMSLVYRTAVRLNLCMTKFIMAFVVVVVVTIEWNCKVPLWR